MLARSKCVMPRSNARRTIARPFSKSSTSPKLCHRPSETAGSNKPLCPQRLYFIFSYRLSAGLYFTFKLLIKFCVAKRIAGFGARVKAKSTLFAGRSLKNRLQKTKMFCRFEGNWRRSSAGLEHGIHKPRVVGSTPTAAITIQRGNSERHIHVR